MRLPWCVPADRVDPGLDGVLTHVDDCCSESNLNYAEIVIDGQTVQECP